MSLKNVASLSASPAAAPSRPPAEPVPIYVAALRPGMLRVAGEVADGVILNWLAAADVPRSIAIVREAAARAGRDPAAVEITARLLIHLDPASPESTRSRAGT